MDSEEFFQVAEALIDTMEFNNVSEESRLRTGISRAYYAAFHKCQKDHYGNQKPKKMRHKVFFTLLKNKGGAFINVEKKLRTLYVMREKSDYRINEKVSKDDALTSLDFSKEIIQTFGSSESI